MCKWRLLEVCEPSRIMPNWCPVRPWEPLSCGPFHGAQDTLSCFYSFLFWIRVAGYLGFFFFKSPPSISSISCSFQSSHYIERRSPSLASHTRSIHTTWTEMETLSPAPICLAYLILFFALIMRMSVYCTFSRDSYMDFVHWISNLF